MLGVSSQAVSKWEDESTLPDILVLPKLADYFGISIDDLMGYAGLDLEVIPPRMNF